jgi:hypothetical protein
VARIDDFQHALEIAWETIGTRDLIEISHNAGVEQRELKGETKILLPFFQRFVTISCPARIIYCEDGGSPLSLQEQGLILHYLLGVRDIPLAGDSITYREIPSGEFYYQPFLQRAQFPFIRRFGADHPTFIKTAFHLGAMKSNMGDAAMIFYPFPKTPVTLVLWKGDEEFLPEGTILFDSSIKLFLPAEDIAYLAGIVVYKIMALAKMNNTLS